MSNSNFVFVTDVNRSVMPIQRENRFQYTFEIQIQYKNGNHLQRRYEPEALFCTVLLSCELVKEFRGSGVVRGCFESICLRRANALP
jgi:hypothetical protein